MNCWPTLNLEGTVTICLNLAQPLISTGFLISFRAVGHTADLFGVNAPITGHRQHLFTNVTFIFSPPVLMHGGLICIAFRPSVTRKEFISQKVLKLGAQNFTTV